MAGMMPARQLAAYKPYAGLDCKLKWQAVSPWKDLAAGRLRQ
jgi:hypothetical protein